MKVGCVSNVNFKSQVVQDNSYMYTLNESYRPTFKEHKGEYIGGILAFAAAAACLAKFAARNTTPKNVVEIADKAIGLNKITGQDRAIAQLKDKILYPIMSLKNESINKNQLRTGLIIGDEDPEKVKQVYDAFIEHSKKLGIRCLKVPDDIKMSKKTLRKLLHAVLDHIAKMSKVNDEFILVGIGDLENIASMNVSKVKMASNLEKKLANIPPGSVTWVATTSHPDKLPYFYNNLPTLFLKLSK